MTGGEGGDDRQKQKGKTLDPRLLMSRMTEGTGKAGMTDKNKKTKPWILYLTGSPIKNVGDKRRG